ncbi:hypothetical protein ATI61_110256 [Archangium gephyra]|uniref:Uncharacterized protein n=2 Tax=Archangium gephyra TaxID=48 RepID=A0ABX9JUK4_9BACT|nr:hypothetical protein [Archangium gephyra]REG27249.1 hypothetical protein ATI61_110256 [Archangium gephyra]
MCASARPLSSSNSRSTGSRLVSSIRRSVWSNWPREASSASTSWALGEISSPRTSRPRCWLSAFNRSAARACPVAKA